MEVFPVGGVEGSFARRADIDRLLQISVTGLYAVYKMPAAAHQEDYWPAGDYGVVFLRPDNSFLIAFVNPNGIVRLDNLPPVDVPDDLLRWTGGEDGVASRRPMITGSAFRPQLSQTIVRQTMSRKCS